MGWKGLAAGLIPSRALPAVKLACWGAILHREYPGYLAGPIAWRVPRAFARGVWPRRFVLFYPTVPRTEHFVLCKILTLLGYGLTDRESDRVALVMKWNGDTFAPTDNRLRELQKRYRVVNLRVEDVSKTHVEQAFETAFGRPLAVDPVKHHGLAVQKSDLNAQHNGMVVECPLPTRVAGMTYERVVDNVVEGDQVEDLRVPIVGGVIPFVYAKRRPLATRFSNTNSTVRLLETNDVLSPDEQSRLLQLCATLGLEYGEVDTLRDRSDGHLYAVDVNPTPFGPPNGLAILERRTALARLLGAFQTVFLQPPLRT